MSAFQSRGDSRTARGRSRPRGNLRSRDTKLDVGTFNGQRAPTSTTSSNLSSTQPNPFPKQNRIPNKQWKNSNPTSAAPRNRVNRPPSTSPSVSSSRARDQSWRNPVNEPSNSYQKQMSELYQNLKKNREKERRDAIRNGFLSDPDRPTSLANAITPVGTCPDMCPEFERVERIVQLMVDGSEKTTSTSNAKVPCEESMVKRFRRSAAGYDEQLPSDIRPPLVLQRTLNYLFDEVIGGSQPLGAVHKFVWDRTRGIRNDFSIQQVTRLDDLKIAIDCFERIARFHILSLHQLSRQDADSGEFDHHQEREQLNNTLLSLMYYYDDSRSKLTSPNEAEFRAYCIIFEIQDQRPDLEDRAQNWPRPLLKDLRIQTALKLYAAAGNTSDDQGPLRPRTPFSVAQANPGRFWALVQSNDVSYLMACVAEIYFNLVRSTALDSIWKAYKGKRGGPLKMEDWVLDDLRLALGFDTEDQTQSYCEDYGFTVSEKESGEAYVDLGSVQGRSLSDSNLRRKQVFSKALVESKRLDRSLPAIIDGLLVSESQSITGNSSGAENSSHSDHEPLFITGDSDDENMKDPSQIETAMPKQDPLHQTSKLNPSANPFNPTPIVNGTTAVTPAPFSNAVSFGKPTPFISLTPPPSNSPSIIKSSTPSSGDPTPLGQQPPKFNFFPPSTTTEVTNPALSSTAIKPTVNGLPTSSADPTPEPKKSLFASPSTFTLDPTKFSFGTSPLFEAAKAKGNAEDDEATKIPDNPTPKPSLFSFQNPKIPDSSPHFSTSVTTTPTAPPSALSPSPLSLSKLTETSTTSTSKPFSMFPPQPVPTAQAIPPIAATPILPSSASFPKSSPLNEAPKPTSDYKLMPVSNGGSFPSSTNITPQVSNSTARLVTTTPFPSKPILNSFVPTVSLAQQAKLSPPKPDPRPAALNSLANSMMLDDEGLLKQFLEYTLGPIIQDSFRQVGDERSWDIARKCRATILSNKYFKRWRANAWKKGLLRKGKERRKNFAKSIQDLSRSAQEQQKAKHPDFQSEAPRSSNQESQDDFLRSIMPPPPTPRQKRKSLPTNLDRYSQEDPKIASGSKRRCHEQSQNVGKISTRRSRANHKRSSTVGNQISSIGPRGTIITSHPSRPDISHLDDGIFLSHSVMQRARNLVGRPKLDTTRTDYFTLKSRGIDPDTPLVPLTKRKRPSEDAQINSNKLPRTSPPHPPNSHRRSLPPPPNFHRKSPPPPPATSKDGSDSDEALFAQMRQVREAMADSISWFQAERAKNELASASISTPRRETEKERRLREFKFTPSRTEQRLRATGANGFLPKGWDGIRTTNGEREEISIEGDGEEGQESLRESSQVEEEEDEEEEEGEDEEEEEEGEDEEEEEEGEDEDDYDDDEFSSSESQAGNEEGMAIMESLRLKKKARWGGPGPGSGSGSTAGGDGGVGGRGMGTRGGMMTRDSRTRLMPASINGNGAVNGDGRAKGSSVEDAIEL